MPLVSDHRQTQSTVYVSYDEEANWAGQRRRWCSGFPYYVATVTISHCCCSHLRAKIGKTED